MNAQYPTEPSISISVSARVKAGQPVELTTLHNMNIKGENKDGNEIYISPMTNVNAGLMRANGSPRSQVHLTYQISEVINEKYSEDTVAINYEISINRERVQNASTLISTGEVVLDFDDSGVYYLWLGGNINLSGAVGGLYVGQFTIEIAYI